MSTFAMLLCLLIMLWYVYWRWSHRKEFDLARKLHGPYSLAFIMISLMAKKLDDLDLALRLDQEYGLQKWYRFWIGPMLMVFPMDPKDIERILSSKEALSKGYIYKLAAPCFNNGLIVSDSAVWHYNRKVISPAFNTFKLMYFADMFTDESEKLTALWKEKVGIKFSPFSDTIGIFVSLPIRTALGDKLFYQLTRNMDFVHFGGQISELMALSHYRVRNVFLHYECIFKLSSCYKRTKKILETYDNFLEEMVRAKRMSNEDDDSFLSHAIKAEKSHPNFGNRQILDELKTFITAAYETTATTSVMVMVMLGIHSEIQEKVFKEQKEILDDLDKRPTFDDLTKMVYLEQVIKETLRLFSTVPAFSREMTGDLTIDDKIIPKGCTIAVSTFLIHRREEYYPNPSVFDPNRFLPEEEKKRHPYTFLPFGGGPRTCLGQRYAMYSMRAFISAVIRRYKIHTDYGLDQALNNMRTDVTLQVEKFKISLSER